MPELHHGEGEAEQCILRALRLAVELSIVILAIEALGALLSHSLALTIDAVHNVPDILAFAVSWTALAGTRSGRTPQFTFGRHRLEVFAGLLNGILVLGTGAVFGYESVQDLVRSGAFAGPVDPVWILVAALPTLVLRLINVRVLGRPTGRVRDLNLRGVLVHLGSDVAITAALLVAGVVLLWNPRYGWVDSAAALFVAGVLVYESLSLLQGGWEVLTEQSPRGLSLDAITRTTLAVPGVTEVHDLHVWAVCDSLVCLTAHVGVKDMAMRDAMGVVRELRARMECDFGIVHATFEIEAP